MTFCLRNLCSINKTHIKSWLLDGFQKVFVKGESLSNEDFALGFHKDTVQHFNKPSASKCKIPALKI